MTSPPSWWLRHQRALAPYVFISPFYLLYGLFLLVPIGVGLYLSCTEWAGLGTPRWVGLRNYQDLMTDSSFWTSIRNTSLYVVFTLCVVVPAALLIAQALNARGLRGRDMFRLAYFMPVVISPIVVALVFGLVFDNEFGLVNGLLEAVLGFGGVDWLGDPAWAQPEGRGVAVSGVRDGQGHLDAPRAGLIGHVQGELPLLHMPDVLGDAAAFPARDLGQVRLRRGGIPGLGQEQPPADRCRSVVRRQVQRDTHLAVGDLPGGAGVLPRHTRRGGPVLEEAGVIEDQRGGPDGVSILQANFAGYGTDPTGWW